MSKNILFLNAYKDSTSISLNVPNRIALLVYQLSQATDVELLLSLHEDEPKEPTIKCKSATLPSYKVISDVPEIVTCCKWPVIVTGNRVTAGLCSVSRQLLKQSDSEMVKSLLGFREACLVACAQSSVWTRFCEVDMVSVAERVIERRCHQRNVLHLPEEIARFEYHLSRPVRMHNVYKAARQQGKGESGVPLETLDLEHCFSEGAYMTLADVILYPCFEIFFLMYSLVTLEQKIPLVCKWFQKVGTRLTQNVTLEIPSFQIEEIVEPIFIKESLYKTDPSRYKPEKRIHTKQSDIESALKLLETIENEIVNEFTPFGHEIHLNWATLPVEVNPKGGALPSHRADRKREQLENIAKAVLKLTGNNNYNIVDFCSGSGHVGILLASLLPNCNIILVENKDRSLLRAEERIKTLSLRNVSILQTNLDYFTGRFDIGVALHACGVATDLVIKVCIESKASFVVCPCCYGGVKNCLDISYPLSQTFRREGVTNENYLNLAHAADQTHDKDNKKTKQGYLCMDVVDTDRKLYAESCGYRVRLGKLQPMECTNKNNLLVGVCKDDIF